MKSWTKIYISTIGNDGWDTGVKCPMRFCDGKVIYNGNYFCSQLNDTCNWAMSHDEETGAPIGNRDKRIWENLLEANKNAT